MARTRGRAEGSRKRERLTTLLLALFPLLVATGFLAPGFVHYLAIAQEQEPEERAVVADRVGPHAHRPLVVPRDFSAGFVPELLDLDQLFISSTYRRHVTDQPIATVSAFERSYGDSIARNSVGQVVADVVFKDAMMVETPETLTAAIDPAGTNLGICGSLHASNCFQDDDMTGQSVIVSVPVPEPSSATLVALGLLGLAFCARRY